MATSDKHQKIELKALIEACQSSLALFVEDTNKIKNINQAKSGDLYKDAKGMNYQLLGEKGMACLEMIRHLAGRCGDHRSHVVLPDAEVNDILKLVDAEISSALNPKINISQEESLS